MNTGPLCRASVFSIHKSWIFPDKLDDRDTRWKLKKTEHYQAKNERTYEKRN